MANGTMIEVGTHTQQDRFISYLALDAENTVQATWEWMDVKGYGGRGSLEVSAMPNDTIELRMSNSKDKPASNDAGALVGSAIAAAGLTEFNVACRWLALRKTIGTADLTTVLLHKVGNG